jgi:hypothetical protein
MKPFTIDINNYSNFTEQSIENNFMVLNIIDFTNQSNVTEDSIENDFMHPMPNNFSN